MKVGLVTQDVAPSRILERFAGRALEDGCDVRSLLGFGGKDGLNVATAEKIGRECDVVVVGFSSSKELRVAEVAAVLTANAAGKRTVAVCDQWGAYHRGIELRKVLNVLCVMDDDDEIEAECLFPETEVIVTGNPLYADFLETRSSREEVLVKGLESRIAQDSKILFVPLGKVASLNTKMIASLLPAVQTLPDAERWTVLFGFHPGDKTHPRIYTETVMAEFPKVATLCVVKPEYKDEMGGVCAEFLAKKIPAEDLIPAVELVVGNMTTVGVEALAKDKLVIDLVSPDALRRFHANNGPRPWKSFAKGASPMVVGEDGEWLSETIVGVLTEDHTLCESVKVGRGKFIADEPSFDPGFDATTELCRAIYESV